MNDNIENNNELESTGAEAQAVTLNETASTEEESPQATELSLQSLLEKALTELDSARKENADLQTSSQSHLKMIEKLIMNDGAVVPRDETSNNSAVNETKTSARTYAQPMSVDDLRGQLFIK